jgi:hypothetical protein
VKGGGYPHMRLEVQPPLLFAGPAGMLALGEAPKLITDLQSLSGTNVLPMSRLQVRQRIPVATGELDQIGCLQDIPILDGAGARTKEIRSQPLSLTPPWPSRRHVPEPPVESERQTRRDRVDPRLKAAGWAVIDFTEGLTITGLSRHAVAEYPTLNGPADYVLVVDGQLLGIVEAKKLSLGPQNVLTQAERYSKGAADGPINVRGYRVPLRPRRLTHGNWPRPVSGMSTFRSEFRFG